MEQAPLRTKLLQNSRKDAKLKRRKDIACTSTAFSHTIFTTGSPAYVL